jgi:hypothetical protein
VRVEDRADLQVGTKERKVRLRSSARWIVFRSVLRNGGFYDNMKEGIGLSCESGRLSGRPISTAARQHRHFLRPHDAGRTRKMEGLGRQRGRNICHGCQNPSFYTPIVLQTLETFCASLDNLSAFLSLLVIVRIGLGCGCDWGRKAKIRTDL